MRPPAAIVPAKARTMAPARRSRRGVGVVTDSNGIGHSWQSGLRDGLRGRPDALAAVDEAEQDRHEEQRRAGGEKQTANDGAPKWCILTGLDRHRRHADDHRERGHHYWPEPCGT